MEQKNYLEDISEIKNMMSRSSKFISLSGLSGILAGIYALIGAYFAKVNIDAYLNKIHEESIPNSPEYYDMTSHSDLTTTLWSIAIAVILAALVTGIILTLKKSKKNGEKTWNRASKRLAINFFIPLVAGGLFCLVLIQMRVASLVWPTTLIFYGMACVNASNYTLGDVRYLGYANIIIGLIATQFIGYGLYFWALGFGIFHILYGSLMYFKYEKKLS